VSTETRVHIGHESDIALACQKGKELAAQTGLSGSELVLVATAISEVARNILVHAHKGEVILDIIHQNDRAGISVTAVDQGPGISNIEQAMTDGFSTGGSLGLGLPGAKRLMDEFSITSSLGNGTTIIMKKWAT